MELLKSTNLGLRFLLELCVLAALGFWGFQASKALVVRSLLGLGAPVLAAVVWGMLGAPQADVHLSAPLHLLLEVVVFGSGVVALFGAGRPGWAWALGLVLIANRVLMFLWQQ